MNPETLQKLYEVGFPHMTKRTNHEFVINEDHEVDGRKGDLHTCKHCDEERFHAYSFVTWSTTDLYYQGCPKAPTRYSEPTLEQLIENCGEGFYRLEKMMEGWECRGDANDFEGRPWSETPKEAVANLYIALNKKT